MILMDWFEQVGNLSVICTKNCKKLVMAWEQWDVVSKWFILIAEFEKSRMLRIKKLYLTTRHHICCSRIIINQRRHIRPSTSCGLVTKTTGKQLFKIVDNYRTASGATPKLLNIFSFVIIIYLFYQSSTNIILYILIVSIWMSIHSCPGQHCRKVHNFFFLNVIFYLKSN